MSLNDLPNIISALAAALATFFAWRSIKISLDESKRNRRSFEFSWQPLIEVTFGATSTLGENSTLDEFILPVTRNEQRFIKLPSHTRSVVNHFEHWREQYRSAQNYETITIPHPDAHYLFIQIKNLQSNPIGDAFDLTITLEFEYAPPNIGIKRVGEVYEPEVVRIPFRFARIGASQSVWGWLAYIEDVPSIKVKVVSILYDGWEKIDTNRGIAGSIEISADKPVIKRAKKLVPQRVQRFADEVVIVEPLWLHDGNYTNEVE